MTNRRKDGALFNAAGTISPVFGEDGAITNYVAVMRDTTRQDMLEKQLRQSQKLEAIGTLAGGIAHDFNNILSAIQGYSELVYAALEENSELREDMGEVLKAAQRASELVDQILTFSRRTEEKRRPLDIRLILRETLKLLRASIPATIAIEEDISEDCGFVVADPTQMHQVIMNLCTNAHHAMRDTGGVLSISLNPVTLDARAASSMLHLKAGDYLLLTVADTGMGMDQKTVERIFEPFYTTKAAEGTGMGLAIVHGIVESYGGEIRVESETGQGTAFSIYLPAAASPPGESKELPPPAGAPQGSGHILLVDDEAPLVDLAARFLRKTGYEVTQCTSSADALEAFREAPSRYQAVLTDQAMPGMSGIELAQAIWAVDSTIPIILMTGFSEEIGHSEAKELGFRGFLTKPIDNSALARTLQAALGERVQDQ